MSRTKLVSRVVGLVVACVATTLAPLASPASACPIAGGCVQPVGVSDQPPTSAFPNANGYRITRGQFKGPDFGHAGLDLANGQSGGEVRSIAVGRVVDRIDSVDTDDFGHLVRIEHVLQSGERAYSIYAHMRAGTVEVSVGDVVVKGQRIGLVNATGYVFGNPPDHLHFTVRKVNSNGCGQVPSRLAACASDSVDNYFDPVSFLAEGAPPTLRSDFYQVSQGGTLVAPATGPPAVPGVLDNDLPPGLLSATFSNTPPGFSDLGGGAFSYSPPAGVVGPVTFSYRVPSGTVLSAPATVTIQVTAAPPPPPSTSTRVFPTVASDGSMTGWENILAGQPCLFSSNSISWRVYSGSFPDTSVLASETLPNCYTLNLYNVNGGGWANGSEGQFWVRVQQTLPSPRDVWFDFFVHNGRAGTQPVAVDDLQYSVSQGGSLSVPAPAVLANDTHPTGATVEFLLPLPVGVTATNTDGSFIIDLSGDPTFTGPLTFGYLVRSGGLVSNIATVSVAVTPAWNGDTIALSSADSDSESPPKVVPDQAGNLTVLWASGARGVTFSMYSASTRQWTGDFPISEAPDYGLPQLEIATDGAGNIVAAWLLQFYPWNGGDRLEFSRYSVTDGTWSVPTRLLFPNLPKLLVEPTGDVIAVWSTSTADRIVQTSRLSVATGIWADPTTLSSPSPRRPHNDEPAMARDPSGNIVVNWIQFTDLFHFTVQSSRFSSAVSSWDAPRDLSGVIFSPFGDGLEPLTIQTDSMGNSIATWVEYPANLGAVRASRFDALADTWSPPVTVSPPGLYSSASTLALDSTGSGLLLWVTERPLPLGTSTFLVQSARFDATSGAWQPTVEVAAFNRSVNTISATFSSSGDAFASWTLGPLTGVANASIQGARLVGGTNTWSATQTLSPVELASTDSEVVSVGSDGAVVAWRASSVTSTVIQARRFPY